MDKQLDIIKDIANIIHNACPASCFDCEDKTIDDFTCTDVKSAEALYEKGYRKVSEVVFEILDSVWEIWNQTFYNDEFEELLYELIIKYESLYGEQHGAN